MKLAGSSKQAALLSPEICIVAGKPTASSGSEGSIPDYRVTVRSGRSRGLRTGHVYTGLVRELERSVTFLGKNAALVSRAKILLVISGFAALT